MDKSCYVCEQVFGPMSLKTSRSRFKLMGLPPPEGMGGADRVCAKCLNKIYQNEIKKIRIKRMKKQKQLKLK